MDSSQSNSSRRPSISSKRSLDDISDVDHDTENDSHKKARESSPCNNDRYFILTATDKSSVSSLSPFLLGKAVQHHAGTVAEIKQEAKVIRQKVQAAIG